MSESNFKVVILGDGRVGKTSILMRYFSNKFDENQQSTLNPSFYEKNMKYNGISNKFCFWDTAGQEQFDALNRIYYNGATGAIIVYDISIPETFQKVEKWIKEVKQMVGQDVIFVILGNKFDLVKSKEQLDEMEEKVNSYAQLHNAKHFTVSAKSGYNLNEAFEYLIDLINKKFKPEKQKKGGIHIEEGEHSKKKGCC